MDAGGVYLNYGQVSQEFIDAARAAQAALRSDPDDSVRLAAWTVPIVLQPTVDAYQDEAGGCKGCHYLGMWAPDWPGYEPMPHGIIWMFEDGIRWAAPQGMYFQVFQTLRHELGHALQRNHVLEHLKQIQAAGMTLEQGLARGWAYGGYSWAFPDALASVPCG